MTAAHALVVLALQTAPAPADTVEPDIVVLAEAGDETDLLRAVKRHPDDARDALAELLRMSVDAPDAAGRVRLLERARSLARVYQRAWSDAFLTRNVERFARWSLEERRQKLQADSLRRVGADSFYRDGPSTAIDLWERSLGQHRALDDVAGEAAALANIGAGYYALGEPSRALRHFRLALELAERAGDLRSVGNVLGNIASVHKDRDELTLAADYYRRALETRPLTGDRRGEAADRNNRGLVLQALGDLSGAAESFTSALQLNRQDGRDRSAADNLTNLANVATVRGAYEPALELYAEALGLSRRSGDVLGEALALQNIGLLHMRWGDYPAAVAHLEDALSVLSRTGPDWRQAEVLSDLAVARGAIGDLQGALEALDEATAEGMGVRHLGPRLALIRADLLTELNDFELAMAFYRQAAAGFGHRGDPAERAEAETGLGYLHLARGDHDAAEEAFIRALAVQEPMDDPRPAALTRVLLGHASFERGDAEASRRAYERALSTYRALDDAVGEATARAALADLDRKTGALGRAERGYREALARVGGRTAPSTRSYLEFGLGRTLMEMARPDEAADAFRRSIEDTEAVGATLPVEERRYGFLADKWDAYAQLAGAELDLGRVASAFETSERMRARQLVDLLARGRTGAAHDEELVRREQHLRRRIGELTLALEAPPAGSSTLRGPPGEPDLLAVGRDELVEARSDYERLLVELKRSSPDYADLVTATTASATDVQRLVPDHAVLLEYLVSEEWTIAFVVDRDGVAALQLPVGRETIRQQVRFFRGTLLPERGADEDELWRAPLRRLYAELVAPIDEAGHLTGRDLLLIAPHAELHYLPFQALLKKTPSGERYLIEAHDVAYVPSATVWRSLSRRDRARGSGTLAMAPQPGALAHSVDEVRRIEDLRPRTAAFVGSRATEERFHEQAPHRAVIHLATFGVLNRRNPLFSYVRLNPGGTADGRLEVHEVFGLNLHASLVVLSACQTGLGTGLVSDVPPGDDWVGLVRAFLHAGAESVLASLWPVNDRSTARLMQSFYTELDRGRTPAGALAAAQRDLLREYRSPFYWAAFELSGGVR